MEQREGKGRRDIKNERIQTIQPQHYELSAPSPHLVSDVLQVGLEVLLCTVQEALRLQVSSTEGQEVNSSEAGLFTRWHKDDDRHFR